MEILGLIIIWPFLILAIGLVGIAFFDSPYYISGFAFPLLLVVVIYLFSLLRKSRGPQTRTQVESLRRALSTISIGFLFPIFVKYLIEGFDTSLLVVIIGLIIGFALTISGLFIKNKVLRHSNLISGFLTLIYVYFQLWDLGELARVVAAAFGLVVAVVIAIIKLKDKLS